MRARCKTLFTHSLTHLQWWRRCSIPAEGRFRRRRDR